MSISSPPFEYHRRLADALLDDLLAQLPALMIVGPRAVGKTTTIERRATSVIRLDVDAEAAAFRADPDAALRGLDEPLLLDEWQAVPGVFGAVRRAVEKGSRPSRFFLTGSVRAELENEVWPGTGRVPRLVMYPMTLREQIGHEDRPSFFDRIADGSIPGVPADTPDLLGYVELALKGGFPETALRLSGRAHRVWLESYLDDLLTHDIARLEEPETKRRDPHKLRRYFEAYAINSAGIADHKTIYDAARVNKATALAYEELLIDLFVVELLPAWSSNRLTRLVHQPKRYVIDAALIATALRVDPQGVIRDGNLLGRILDTFVLSQMRPEVVLSDVRPRLYHLRTKQGRQEIDVLAELGGQKLVGVEIKASAAPTRDDARHLAWLRDEVGDRFVIGVVFHTGPRQYKLGEKIIACPISTLWST